MLSTSTLPIHLSTTSFINPGQAHIIGNVKYIGPLDMYFGPFWGVGPLGLNLGPFWGVGPYHFILHTEQIIEL